MALIHSQLKTKEIESEPWNVNAILYQPLEAEQILLAENASCLAVKTFLRMCNLPFQVKIRANAEFMSPGGRLTKLPLICVGAFVVAELDQISNLVENKGISLTPHFDADEKADLRSYITLAENLFSMAELYFTWKDTDNLNQDTLKRNGSVYPWPLNHIQNWRKKRNIINLLSVYGWNSLTTEDVLKRVERCCEQFVDKLGDKKYFYGDKPSELDAVIFGHLFTLMSTNLPNNQLMVQVSRYPKLIDFCKHIEKEYF